MKEMDASVAALRKGLDVKKGKGSKQSSSAEEHVELCPLAKQLLARGQTGAAGLSDTFSLKRVCFMHIGESFLKKIDKAEWIRWRAARPFEEIPLATLLMDGEVSLAQWYRNNKNRAKHKRKVFQDVVEIADSKKQKNEDVCIGQWLPEDLYFYDYQKVRGLSRMESDTKFVDEVDHGRGRKYSGVWHVKIYKGR
jgi:hypothetical protein